MQRFRNPPEGLDMQPVFWSPQARMGSEPWHSMSPRLISKKLIKAIHGYGSEIRPNQPRCWFFLVILVHSLNPTKLCKVCCSLGLFPSECEPSVHILVAWISMWYLCCEKKNCKFWFLCKQSSNWPNECAENHPFVTRKDSTVLINSKSWSELFVWKRNTTSLLIRIMYSTHEPSYFRTIFVNQIFCG